MSKINSVYTIMGARTTAKHEREINDYYATNPEAVKDLLKVESFDESIWECACGEGHISKVLLKHGYKVLSSDIIERSFKCEIIDFLNARVFFNGDIITNPPYKYALEFVEKGLRIIPEGNKIAMFLKLTFLEGQKRRAFFEKNPPIRIYVYSSRMKCALGGDFEAHKSSAICFAWFIWQKGYKGDPTIHWI